MNFDDEEHRVKRILDDESNNTDDADDTNTTKNNKKDIEKNDNEDAGSNTPPHVSTSASDKNTPHPSDTDTNSDDDDLDNRVSLYDGDISESSESNAHENTSHTDDVKKNTNSNSANNSANNSDDETPNTTPKDTNLTDKTSENNTAGNNNGGGDNGGGNNTNNDDEGSRFIPPSQIAKNKKKEAEPMGLLEHLSELRRRLTRIVIILIIGFFGFYGVSELAYAYLAQPLVNQLPEGSTLIYTSPQGAFFTYLKVALMLSVIGTSPFTFYQIWAFIAPGLYKEEQTAIAPLAFFSAFFFISGTAFCYFMVFPVAFKFFIGFTSDIVVPMISVEEYLSFSLKLIIAFGLVFEMPLFSYFLAKLRIITPEAMRKHRKYAALAIFVIAAILTPPDVFSQVLMAIPMLVLYEISIYVAKVARGKAKKEETEKVEETEEDINDKINNFK